MGSGDTTDYSWPPDVKYKTWTSFRVVHPTRCAMGTDMPTSTAAFDTKESTGSADSFDCFRKIWDPEFSMQRWPPEDRPFVEFARSVDAEGSDVDIFLREDQGPVPSHEAEDIAAFCHGRSLYKAPHGHRGAWLDDRETASGACREYPYRLSAVQLYARLKRQVCFASRGLLA